jgi:integrase
VAQARPQLAVDLPHFRHVFATWALHEARVPTEDLSRLLGHSSTRVTQDIYVHVRDDMFDRFFEATG